MYQAFNARPEGATSSQPRASERSERHPGLGRRVSDTPPEGAKAATGGICRHNFPPPSPASPSPSPAFNAAIPRISSSVIAFAPSVGVSETHLPNPGCRSLRSLALGWELVAPSGRALNAWPLNDIPSGRALDACGGMSVCYRTTVARRMRTSSKGRLFSSRPTHWMRSTTARPSVISPNTVYWPSR